MILSRANTKFLLRIIIVSSLSLTLAFGIRVVFQTDEIEKLIPRSAARDILLFAGPITSIAILHYTLAVKSFNIRSLGVEAAAILGNALLYASLVVPIIVGTYIEVPVANCPWYKVRCPDELVWVPNPIMPYILGVSGALVLGWVLWSQIIRR
jgi:hypothetical protein